MFEKIVGVSPSGKAAGFDPAIPRFKSWYSSHAEVAKLVDALDLGSSIYDVRVQVSPSAPSLLDVKQENFRWSIAKR